MPRDVVKDEVEVIEVDIEVGNLEVVPKLVLCDVVVVINSVLFEVAVLSVPLGTVVAKSEVVAVLKDIVDMVVVKIAVEFIVQSTTHGQSQTGPTGYCC